MATIDELTRLDREVDAAERVALMNRAEHLREAVLELPSASKLARSFVKHAAEFERWAQTQPRGHVASMGGDSLREMNRELRDDALEGISATLTEYAEALPVNDQYGRLLLQLADVLDR